MMQQVDNICNARVREDCSDGSCEKGGRNRDQYDPNGLERRVPSLDSWKRSAGRSVWLPHFSYLLLWRWHDVRDQKSFVW